MIRVRDAVRAGYAVIGVLAGMATLAPGSAVAAPSVSATFFANADSPVDITNAGDSRMFVVEQGGTIQVVSSTGTVLGTFLDIDDRVIGGGERGLLGLAFHPNYVSNGFFYVNYTAIPTTR